MGKASGVSRRRRKNKNPRFLHRTKLQKMKRKLTKKPKGFECGIISEKWNSKLSANNNLKSMGLTLDPNKVLPQPKNVIEEIMDFQQTKGVNVKKTKKVKSDVIMELEKESQKKKKKNFRFGPATVKFCIYMMEKYGEDYEAMSMDSKNHYQESAGQIRQKINKFKSIPIHWNAYLKSKDSSDASNLNMEICK